VSGGGNRLPVLAAEIRRAHADVQEAAKTAAEHAITAGHALIEAKELVKHGEWLPWLKEHCALAERTAQLYMKIAKSGLNSATVADLGLKFAVNALLVHFADPWDAQPDEAMREWLIYMLFRCRNGGRLEVEERGAHWAQRNGFDTPSMWVGEEGDQYRELYKQRRLWRAGRFSDDYKEQWRQFLIGQSGRTIEDIEAELRAIADAEPETPPQGTRPKRRRRRS
jgi:Protein of unknown function (DUF3102)